MRLLLFTDGSVNTQSKMGVGAYLAISDLSHDFRKMSGQVRIKQFENTSSSKLELQTFLWAIDEIDASEITAYTDSQNIISLPSRRQRFENLNYHSKSGKQLKNHNLYRSFFELTDQVNLTLIKVSGHLPGSQKDKIDNIFKLVDRASRNAQRDVG